MVRSFLVAPLALATSVSAQTRYTVLDLGETVPGAGSYAFAMNQAGAIAGTVPQDPTCNPCRAHAMAVVNGVITDLGLPAGAGPDSEAYSINALGQVVGRSEQQGYYIPVLWLPTPAYGAPAGWTILPQFTGGRQSQAWGINDAGEIAGESRSAGALAPHPVVWRYQGAAWQIQDLGTLGGPYGRARGINQQGQVVGQANLPGGSLSPFIWLPAAAYGLPAGMTGLDPAGGNGDMWVITEQGQVAGNMSLTAAIWLPSAAWGLPAGLSLIDASSLGTIGFSEFWGLNTAGVAVGQVGIRVGTTTFYYGWIWERGQIALLHNRLEPAGGWTIIDARAVNEAGQIAATGYASNPAQSHALLLTPVGVCYANCDASTGLPVLNVNDFVCFQSRFAAADPYADCNHDSQLNVNDFVCFQSAFAAGCP
jgi:uncharacterized membrane protein